MYAYSIKRLPGVIAIDACTLVVSSNIFPWHASGASGHIAKIISTDIAEKVFIGSFRVSTEAELVPNVCSFAISWRWLRIRAPETRLRPCRYLKLNEYDGGIHTTRIGSTIGLASKGGIVHWCLFVQMTARNDRRSTLHPRYVTHTSPFACVRSINTCRKHHVDRSRRERFRPFLLLLEKKLELATIFYGFLISWRRIRRRPHETQPCGRRFLRLDLAERVRWRNPHHQHDRVVGCVVVKGRHRSCASIRQTNRSE